MVTESNAMNSIKITIRKENYDKGIDYIVDIYDDAGCIISKIYDDVSIQYPLDNINITQRWNQNENLAEII